GRPVQVIGPAENGFQLREHDLRQSPDAQTELRRLAACEGTEPFDLQQGPLIRGRLVQTAENDHSLLLTIHHIVSDGWSMRVLVDELSTLYKAYRNGEVESLPELPVQYADYAAWQRHWLSGEVWQRQAEYWRNALAGAPALLELPTDRVRPVERDYAGDAVEIELEADLMRELKAFSRRQGTTLYMTLLAGWAALLARLSGQEEAVIGTPVANRMRSEIEPMIGFFVNTLALRIDVSGSPTVGELLTRVKSWTLEAQENQDIPFEQVVEILQPPRSLAHAPVFPVMVAWQNAPEGNLDLPDLTITALAAPQVTAKFDLSLSLQEAGQQVVGTLGYATALFDRATVRRYLGHWRILLEAMVTNDAQAVDRLPLLRESERRQGLVGGNAAEADDPAARSRAAGDWREKCVHELFQERVEESPDAVALVHQDRSLTYSELNLRANRLARRLGELGVGPDARVAICMERGLEMVVGLLATLKAGGAYVPLDPAYPAERLALMMEDSSPVVLLTCGPGGGTLTWPLPALPILNLESDAPKWDEMSEHNPARAEVGLDVRSLAYIIYTSGSTGLPKGVAITHQSLLNYVQAICDRFGF